MYQNVICEKSVALGSNRLSHGTGIDVHSVKKRALMVAVGKCCSNKEPWIFNENDLHFFFFFNSL